MISSPKSEHQLASRTFRANYTVIGGFNQEIPVQLRYRVPQFIQHSLNVAPTISLSVKMLHQCYLVAFFSLNFVSLKNSLFRAPFLLIFSFEQKSKGHRRATFLLSFYYL